jgi:hypothetical protein
MNNWKPLLEKALANKCPGTTVKWNGNDPTLVIPDDLNDKAPEIGEFTTDLWTSWGGEVVTYPGRSAQGFCIGSSAVEISPHLRR